MPRRNGTDGVKVEQDEAEDRWWRWLRADLDREQKERRDD